MLVNRNEHNSKTHKIVTKNLKEEEKSSRVNIRSWKRPMACNSKAWLSWLGAKPFTPRLNPQAPRVLGMHGFKFVTAASLVCCTFFVDGHIL